MGSRCSSSPRPRGAQHIRRREHHPGDHFVTLLRSHWLGPGLRRMTFGCDDVGDGWFDGDRVLVRVAEQTRRYYTVCNVDPRRRCFDILAVAHPHGAGGRWVGSALDGDVTCVFGPKPDLDVRVPAARDVVLLGDETTIGLFEAVRRGGPRGVGLRGAFEHSPAVVPTCSAVANLDPFPRDPRAPGAALHRWLREDVRWDPSTVFFVGGHGAAVRALRLILLGMGVRGSAIRSRAYWGRPANAAA